MAIIIRPNSGINNAMAGLAAGFGQGMQLGLQQEKLRTEQEKINAILAREERQAILAEAADRRAQTAFDRSMQEREADAEARGYLAATQQDFAMLQNPSLIPEPEKTFRLPEKFMQPLKFAEAFNQMMGGLEKKQAYQEVRARYDQNMAAAEKLARYMSPDMGQMYLQETNKRNLLMADDAARQSFGSYVADLQSRGAFQLLDQQGQPVDDPQLAARLKLLLEQAQNPLIPLSQTQAKLEELLESVGKNNQKKRDNQFQLGRIEAGIQEATATGNEAGVIAFQELRQYYSQNLWATPQQLSARWEAARNGRVLRQLPDGREISVDAKNADAEFKKRLDEFNQLKTLELEVAQLKKSAAQADIDKTKAETARTDAQTDYTKNRGQGFDLPQAYSTATRMYSQLSDDQKWDLEQQGFTPDMWIGQMAQQLMSGGGGMAGAAFAGAPSTPSGAMPGAQTVAVGNQQVALTPEIKQQLNREADELQLKGLERRDFAKWRLENLQANLADFKPAAPATPKAEDESKAPPETPAVQMTEEQASANLNRIKELTSKKDKTLDEALELQTLKTQQDESYFAVERQKKKAVEQQNLRRDVNAAIKFLTDKRETAGTANKNLITLPKSQTDFDKLMTYLSRERGTQQYMKQLGMYAQAAGFNVNKWSDKISVLSPEDLAIAKEELAPKTP